MNAAPTRMINMGLHASNLAARFLFVFFLAKYLTPAEVGYYGLFAAAIGYALYFVGLDFYAYATREMIKIPKENRGLMLKSQALLSAGLYLAFLPIFLFLLLQHTHWPTYLIAWFVPLLIAEHFNQEMSRLLVALSEQITASVVLFVRQGSWALALVALMHTQASSRHIHAVLWLWFVAGMAAALLAIWKVRSLNMGGWGKPVDRAWIARGVKVSLSLLLATLALRGFQTFDRYWLEAIGGIEVVAAYVVFIGVAGSLLAFLDAGVFSFAYPVLVKLNHEKHFALMRAKILSTLWQTLVLCVGFALASWLALPHLLQWIDREAYTSALHFYPWLLLAMVINAIGLVPHYALYALGQDKPIIHSHIAALLAFVASVWLMADHFFTLAIPLGLLIAFSVILVWKTAAYLRCLPNMQSGHAAQKTSQ